MIATLLLVEDEDDTREILCRALERAGYRCLAAGSVRAAIEHVETGAPIDIVVTDIVLADDDSGGLALLTELRRREIKAPVVVITAFADVQKVKVALNEGAAHFLEKPFAAQELIDVVALVRKPQHDAEGAIERALVRVPLTEKERKVARHLLRGLSSSEIAELESNSPKTIRQHVSQIYAKYGVSSRAELFRLVYLE